MWDELEDEHNIQNQLQIQSDLSTTQVSAEDLNAFHSYQEVRNTLQELIINFTYYNSTIIHITTHITLPMTTSIGELNKRVHVKTATLTTRNTNVMECNRRNITL